MSLPPTKIGKPVQYQTVGAFPSPADPEIGGLTPTATYAGRTPFYAAAGTGGGGGAVSQWSTFPAVTPVRANQIQNETGDFGLPGQILSIDPTGAQIEWVDNTHTGAVGPAGAIQYSDGAGGFVGTAEFNFSPTNFTITGGPDTNSIQLYGTTTADMKLTSVNSIVLDAPGGFVTLNPTSGVVTIPNLQTNTVPVGRATNYVIIDETDGRLYAGTSTAGGGAVGPAGAIQFSDGAGNFQGLPAFVFDPTKTSISSGSGTNTVQLADASGNLNLTSTVNLKAAAAAINLNATTALAATTPELSLTIGGGSGTSGQVLTAVGDGKAVWLDNGGGGSAATWATYPASADVSLPNRSFTITSASPGVSYPLAKLNSNVQIGDAANLPLFPDFNALVASFNVGSLVAPATTMNVYSLGGINLNSAAGASILGGGGVAVGGGGGVSITGGGAVTVTGIGGVAVNGGGAVTVDGGGGISIIGAGALSIAAGGISVAGGGVAVTAGGLSLAGGDILVTAGAIQIGTAALAGAGLVAYGSNVRVLPIPGFDAALITDSIQAYTTDSLAIQGVASVAGGNNVSVSSGQTLTITSANTAVVNIAGTPGAIGQVLGSNGAGGTIWINGSSGAADGPVGALQYSDGAGNFLGNAGLVYDGTSKLTNTASTNYINLNDTAGGNSIDVTSGGPMNLNALGDIGMVSQTYIALECVQPLSVTINNDSGVTGQYLGSDGSGNVVWVTPPAPALAVGPVGALQYTNGTGNFQGNAGLVYDGASKLTNTASSNYLQLNDSATGNGVDLVATSGKLSVTSQTAMGVTIAGSAGATGQYLASNGAGGTVWATPPAATPVLSKFGSTSGALALTAAYQAMATQTFTSTVSAAQVTVSATLNVTNSGGVDALVSARLLINGTAGVVQQLTVPNNHFQQVVCIGGGISAAAGTPFNVIIQALTVGGTVTRVNACITSIAQTTLSA